MEILKETQAARNVSHGISTSTTEEDKESVVSLFTPDHRRNKGFNEDDASGFHVK